MAKTKDNIIPSAKKEADQKLASLRSAFVAATKEKRSSGIKIKIKNKK